MNDFDPTVSKKALHNLFLTLFLRGRTSRGLQKEKAPTSMGRKLLLVVALYGLMGLMALFFMGQPVFALSIYLHALTFSFLGMFLASSAGEVLFNKEEADILLHRPIAPQDLLWAKIRVLFGASLWLAGAFNLAGLVVGYLAPDGGIGFVLAHTVSIGMQAIFCAGSVVIAYQLCLRCFGRERLDGLITGAQVIVSVCAVGGGQLLPQFMFRADKIGTMENFSWWIALLPPAWFAGFDDALSGSMALNSWLLAALAVGATIFVVWIAFSKLAGDYQGGIQQLNESLSPRKQKRPGRRWTDILVDTPPLQWWLRDPVARASFLLTTAYLLRDRDVKLRVYPSLAPFIVLPIIMLLPRMGQEESGFDIFSTSIAYGYLAILPVMGINLIQYSQQWQASDVFRATPMAGPGLLCDGARRAVICVLTLPIMLIFGLIVFLMQRDVSSIALVIPSLVAMPVFALLPSLDGSGVPLSMPTEEAKGTARGLILFGVMFISFPLSAVAALSWKYDYFLSFLAVEIVLAVALYKGLRYTLVGRRWRSLE